MCEWRGAGKSWLPPFPPFLEKWQLYYMTVVTFNWFGSINLCWLFTAFIFQIWAEDGRPQCRIYNKRQQSGDEVPVPQRDKSQRNLWWDVSYIRQQSPSCLTVKNWVAQFTTGHFNAEMKTVLEGHLWLLSLKMWTPFMAWSWKNTEFQPKRWQRLWRYHRNM